MMKLMLAFALSLLIVGCADSGATSENDSVAAKEPGSVAEGMGIDTGAASAEPATNGPPADARAAANEPAKPVPFHKREAKLVDKEKAMAENPSMVEVENKINASDPLTAVSQSYFNMASRVRVIQLKHSVDLMHATDGEWPSFAAFDKLMKQHDIKLNGLYPWQVYAYDQQTGGISILEDRAEKKRQYEATGREYPHAE